MLQIITSYWAKSIPLRQFDWEAVTDNYDGERCPIGYGETERKASQELFALIYAFADLQKAYEEDT